MDDPLLTDTCSAFASLAAARRLVVTDSQSATAQHFHLATKKDAEKTRARIHTDQSAAESPELKKPVKDVETWREK